MANLSAQPPKAFYGRRKGRALKQNATELINDLLPLYHYDGNKLNQYQQHVLEIGFGHGEHIYHCAKANPNCYFLGCEAFANGVGKLLAMLNNTPLANLQIYHGDAIDILNELPINQWQEVFLLYPDPWPKTRHHKRRFINQQHVKTLYQLLQNNGRLTMASDHEDYVNWIIFHMQQFQYLRWCAISADDWRNPPNNWVTTHYEQKAKKHHRKCYYLQYQK